MAREKTLKQRVMNEVDSALRDALRLQRKALTDYIRKRRAQRANAIEAARSKCATSLVRAKARAQSIRAEARARANETIEASKRACRKGILKAKRVGAKDVTSARHERAQALNDERRIKAGPKRLYLTRSERKQDSDNEVRRNLPKELHAAWDATKRGFKAKPRASRLEQFLQWAEENPSEVVELSMRTNDYEAEAQRELERVERALKRKQPLTADDLRILGTTRAELESVGLNPDDPDDVAQFLAGYADHWSTKSEEPF